MRMSVDRRASAAGKFGGPHEIVVAAESDRVPPAAQGDVVDDLESALFVEVGISAVDHGEGVGDLEMRLCADGRKIE